MTERVPLRSGLPVLWSYARPHVKAIALGVTLGLCATAITLATPLATRWVLDSLGQELELVVPILVLLALLLVGTGSSLLQSVLLGRLAERIVLDTRRTLVSRFFRARLSDVQALRTGELVTRVTSDTVLLREAASSSVVQLVNGIVALVGTIVLMSLLDWQLLLTTLVSLGIVGTVFFILMPHIGHADKRAQDAMGRLGARLEGGLRALRTVKAAGAEGREIARVGADAENSAQNSVHSVLLRAIVGAVAGGGTQLVIILVLGLGAWRVGAGTLDVSTLVAFLLYAFNIGSPISTLAGAFSSLQSGLVAAVRIQETAYMKDEEETAVLPSVSSLAGEGRGSPVLALRNVTVSYPAAREPALRNLTVEIPRTGHLAIVGPSGAGKTTIFSLLLRFFEPDDGHVELDGRPYKEWSLHGVRSRIAYVEQEAPIVPGTIRDNVTLRSGQSTSDAECWNALEAVRLADKVLSLSGALDAEVSEKDLSGGERQRLALARALITPPSILLLDEATAQLDAVTEAAVQQVIERVATSGAVVTIAHRLSTILEAPRILLLEDGVVRAEGTHPELLQSDGLYREFIAALKIGCT